MSFGTFCGQDPTDPDTFQRVLAKYLDESVQPPLQDLTSVLNVGNDGGNIAIVNGGAIGCDALSTPFGYIDSLDATELSDITSVLGLKINPVGALKIKGAETKGNILVGDGTNTVGLPVGANGLVLKANSSSLTGLGVEWAVDGTSGITGVSAGVNITIDNTNPLVPSIAVSNPLTNQITITNSGVGGQSNPTLTINNTNATGSVALEIYKNKPTAGIAGDVLFNQSVYGKDAGNAKQEYTRISHTLRDSSSGVEDGSIEMGCFVNGAFANFLQINGNENEVNCLKVLDMGGNNIRTTTGSLTLDGTSAPSGSGDINLNPRATAFCNVNGRLRIPSTADNLVIGTSGSGYSGLMSAQGTNYTSTSGSAFSQISFSGVRLAQGTLFAEEKTNVQTYQEITITDTTNPAENLTTNLTLTGLGLVRTDTGSGNQQNFSFNNDSASGGTIDYTNTIGSNGILMRSNQSITFESTTGLFFLTNLPTSIGGLPTGALWNNSGVLSVV
jgi:hypothetical protein